jgi:hypothetical protein
MTEKKRRKYHVRAERAGFSLINWRGMATHRPVEIVKFLSEMRARLISDRARSEDELSAAQLILIDRIISKVGIIRGIEEYIRREGIFVNGDLRPILKENYLAWTNSLRRDLESLGLKKEELGDFVDLGKLIKESESRPRSDDEGQTDQEKDGENAREALGEAIVGGDGELSGEKLPD